MSIVLAGAGRSVLSGIGTTSDMRAPALLLMGDSRTERNTVTFWPLSLSDAGLTRTGQRWPSTNVGVSGATVASALAVLTSTIASIPIPTGTTNLRVLMNFGVNDVGALPSEAVWEANYLAIIDAIHGFTADAVPSDDIACLCLDWRRR